MEKERRAKTVGKRPKDRRPRVIYRHKYGLRKNGAGGKGTWGVPGCELIPVEVDVNDPGYNSEDDSNIVFYKVQKDEDQEERHEITLKEYKEHADLIIEEYFSCQDIDELIECLHELDCPHYHYEIIMRFVMRAIDFGPRECELVSQMINCLVGDEFSDTDIIKAFEKLLQRIADWKLDVPNVEEYLAKFIARAVADEVLPPSVLVDPIWIEKNKDVLKMAGDLLNMKHGLARMEKIWGTGSLMTVEEFKNEMKQALEEYLLSLDLDECLRCIMELNQPFFGHEFVYRSIILGMDGDESQIQVIEALLKEAVLRRVLLFSQLILGLHRVYDTLEDTKLDVPNAPTILDNVLEFFLKENILTQDDVQSIKLEE